jgi:hypothetical protein
MVMVALLMAVTAQALASPGCQWQAARHVVSRKASGHTTFWSLKANAQLNREDPGTAPRLASYRRWVHANTSWTARQGLANLFNLLRQAKENGSLLFPVAVFNTGQVVHGKAGRIRPMACRESLVFDEFLTVVDLTKSPQEAHAYYLRKGQQVLILADFYDHPGDLGTGPSLLTEREVHRRIRAGWRLWISYHNHPFDFANSYGDIGGNLAPSEADVESYQSELPQMAIITNGLESLVLRKSDFNKFKTRR